MTGYVVSEAAARDIEDVGQRIFIANKHAARRLLKDLVSSFQLLVETPQAGHLRSDLTATSLRFWTVRKRYLIVYRERATGIEIVRVLDGRRDVAALLR